MFAAQNAEDEEVEVAEDDAITRSPAASVQVDYVDEVEAGEEDARCEESEDDEGEDEDGEADESDAPTPKHSQPAPSPPSRGSPPRRSARNQMLAVGTRLSIARQDEGGCTRATVVGIKAGSVACVVHDDMFWAGFKIDELHESLEAGEITIIPESEDVLSLLHAHVMLSPFNGAPPDAFLFDEVSGSHHGGWRVFTELQPAPVNGKFGQRYSEPRSPCTLHKGMQVSLSGRVTRLVPMKRTETKEPISTVTEFTLLGFVQATLPSQKCYWALVCSTSTSTVYVASIFGKEGDCHMHLVRHAAVASRDTLKASLDEATVSPQALERS